MRSTPVAVWTVCAFGILEIAPAFSQSAGVSTDADIDCLDRITLNGVPIGHIARARSGFEIQFSVGPKNEEQWARILSAVAARLKNHIPRAGLSCPE